MDSVEHSSLVAALSGTYSIDREIGRGAWGIVFLAHDVRHRRAVAIKVMRTGDVGQAATDRFRREIALEARLQHPHIVPLFDSGELPGGSYFVMPYIAGESLQQRIAREGALPLSEALVIAQQVADALAYAHERGVIHRDIKPANILLADGNAHVADFGVARAIDPGTDPHAITLSGTQVGTPAYMSPEQAASDPSLDGRSDIYSLGCVLYEMLSGRPPFDGSRPGSVMARHALDPVPPIRTVRPSIAVELEQVVMRALSKSPSDRYPNARELQKALQAVDLEARASPARSRSARRFRRALTGAAVGVPLLGWLTWAVVDTGLGRAAIPIDSSRVVVFPLEGPDTTAARADEQLRRALNRWEDLALVDRFAVREALGGSALTVQRARNITRQLGAGRFVRGSIAGNGFGAEVRVALYDVDGGSSTLAEGMTRLPGEGPASDSAFDQLADRLIMRQPIPAGAVLPLGTKVLAAAEDYLRGRDAVTRWALDSAAAAFDRAWRRDNSFGHAALWLALTRYWLNEPTGTWRIAAQAAARDSASLDSREMVAASALMAQLDGDLGLACDTWQGLTQKAPFDFWSWYSSAVCLDTDKRIVADPSTRSGWRFRSSYHTALLHYLRAFELMPSVHRALHDNSFERVRSLLFVSANVMRAGSTAGGGQYFLASPLLEGDTLVFIPYSMDQVGSAALGAIYPSPDAAARTTRRQRQLFREIATSWAASDPSSLDAREALALALQLLGDPAALDTLARAVAQASTRSERIRLAGTEAWIRLRFAVPDDHGTLRLVRALADSVLRLDADDVGLRSHTSLAALTGRLNDVIELSSGTRSSLAFNVPADISASAEELLALAAFGVSGDTVVKLERRLSELIAEAVPRDERQQLRQVALARATALAWPHVLMPMLASPPDESDYLVSAIAADTRGDSAAVRIALDELRELRRHVPPASVSFDALLTETTLLSRHGFDQEAANWLDEAMAALRVATPDFDPINTAALVRAMALRAELAQKLGDRDGARRWAGAVVELWADADPLLQPLVERMRILAT